MSIIKLVLSHEDNAVEPDGLEFGISSVEGLEPDAAQINTEFNIQADGLYWVWYKTVGSVWRDTQVVSCEVNCGKFGLLKEQISTYQLVSQPISAYTDVLLSGLMVASRNGQGELLASKDTYRVGSTGTAMVTVSVMLNKFDPLLFGQVRVIRDNAVTAVYSHYAMSNFLNFNKNLTLQKNDLVQVVLFGSIDNYTVVDPAQGHQKENGLSVVIY
jgi:hypothetical protein